MLSITALHASSYLLNPTASHVLPTPHQNPTQPSPLPADTTITRVTPIELPSYRRLITSIIPIRYSDKFYSLATSDPHVTHTIALCAVQQPTPTRKRKHPSTPIPISEILSPDQPQVIAGIQARLEPLPDSSSTVPSTNPAEQTYDLYIQTLCTSAPYRRLRLASALLDALITTILQIHSEKRITSVYAHVWEANEDALEWYANRGFIIEGERVEGYYRRLKPNGARVLRRRLGVPDVLRAKQLSNEGVEEKGGSFDGRTRDQGVKKNEGEDG